MNEELERAVAAVVAERTGKFDQSFASVAALIPHYLPAALADRLVTDIPSTVAWEVVADILGILIWSTDDNGSAIMRAAERWLVEAQDLRRIRIALHLDVYPFATADEMRKVFAVVAHRFPELAPRCVALADARTAGN